MMVIIGILSCLVLVSSPVFPASGDEGEDAGVALRLDPSARSSGFGSAFTARANEPESLHFNPASLGSQTYTESMLTHFQLVADIRYNHASLVTPIVKNESGLGFSLTSLDYGDIPQAKIDNQNPQTAGLGDFNADDFSAAGSFGLSLNESVKAGVTARYFRSSIAEYDASTMTGDLGIQYQIVPDGLILGAAARNVGGDLKFVSEEDDLSTVYDVGMFSSIPIRQGKDRLNVGADIVFPHSAGGYLSAGVEYGFFRTLFLRLGYNGAQDADDGFTIGGGVHDERFKINYSYVPFDELGDHQRLTLSYVFAGLPGEISEDEESPSVRREKPKKKRKKPRTRKSKKQRDGLSDELQRDKNIPFVKPYPTKSWRMDFQRGKLAYKRGNYARARNYFRRAHHRKPETIKTLIWLGTMEWYLGENQSAVERMKRVLELDPENKIARKNLSRIRQSE